MRAALNPFSPGSGLRPPALVGRAAEIEAFDVTVERATRGLNARGMILSGLRGVGKTVLLNELRHRAEDAEWFVVGLEARPDEVGATSARETLAREISAQARQLARGSALTERVRAALATITAFNAKIGPGGIDLGVELERGRGDSGQIDVDLPELVQDLCAALKDQGRAFALFIDELQDLDRDLLRALLVTQHQAGQRDWPFFLIGAGLPHLPGVLAETRSYAERLFDYRRIAQLPEDEATKALVAPASEHEVDFDPTALQLLLDASAGYPYFLQEYGRAAWDVAPGPEVITRDDAATAINVGLQRLDDGFFRARWDRATRSERRMLIAMAADGEGPSSSSEVARRMNIRASSLGPYRASLINKGLVYAPEHGKVAYTVPGMSDYVHRHREDFDR